MSPEALTGFLAWLEAAPPGQRNAPATAEPTTQRGATHHSTGDRSAVAAGDPHHVAVLRGWRAGPG